MLSCLNENDDDERTHILATMVSLKELSCEEGSFVNKTIWEYYHTIIDIIVDGLVLGLHNIPLF